MQKYFYIKFIYNCVQLKSLISLWYLYAASRLRESELLGLTKTKPFTHYDALYYVNILQNHVSILHALY